MLAIVVVKVTCAGVGNIDFERRVRRNTSIAETGCSLGSESVRADRMKGFVTCIPLFTLVFCFSTRRVASTPAPIASGSGLQSKNWKTITMFELYYDNKGWGHVHNESQNARFRGMCVVPGKERPKSWDVSAPAIMPILKDHLYQQLLCEYSAIFAAANQAALWVNKDKKRANPSPKLSSETPTGKLLIQPVKWIGFVSWKAYQKWADLKDEVMETFAANLENSSVPDNAVIYWNNHGIPKWRPYFYETCVDGHGFGCVTVYSSTFALMFRSTAGLEIEDNMRSLKLAFFNQNAETFLPKMPPFLPGWVMCSYFITSSPSLVEYARFATAFFVTIESTFNLHDNLTFCPIDTLWWGNKLCWCFIMERLVNIWWYHTGRPMYWLDRVSGNLTEFAPVAEREMYPWFSEENMEQMLEEFPKRLSGRSLRLYNSIAGRLF